MLNSTSFLFVSYFHLPLVEHWTQQPALPVLYSQGLISSLDVGVGKAAATSAIITLPRFSFSQPFHASSYILAH